MANPFDGYYLQHCVGPSYDWGSSNPSYHISISNGRDREQFYYREFPEMTELVNYRADPEHADCEFQKIWIKAPFSIPFNRHNPLQSILFLYQLKQSGKLEKLSLL